MTRPSQAAVDSKDALSAEEGCASQASGHPSEARAAAVHELCERLTAIGNYIASAVRLSEIDPAALAQPPPRLTEVLNKAMGQVDQADAVINRYRNLLAKEGKMGSEREQAIQERAFVLWEQDGHPDGKDLDHWLRAEAEILGDPDAGVTDTGKVVGHPRTEPLATSPKRPGPG